MVKNGRTSAIQRSGQMVETSDWTTDEQIVGVGAQTSKGYKFKHLIISHKFCFHSRRKFQQNRSVEKIFSDFLKWKANILPLITFSQGKLDHILICLFSVSFFLSFFSSNSGSGKLASFLGK